MKQDFNRVKSDVETIQKAMGLAPSIGVEWIQWMKRDRWFSLWWCVPGLIVIATSLMSFDHVTRYWGLVADQWAGLLVAGTLLALSSGYMRQVKGTDGRPEAMVRESKRVTGMTAQGFTFGLALLLQVLLYFVWGRVYHVAFEPFWAGLFILLGSSCLVAALASKASILLGYAVPFLVYGLCLPLANGNHKAKGILLGSMFIAVALSFSIIQVLQIRKVERQHESN